ncbi:MAG: tetratricopeptide repeat protein [Reichenbachiella sp.]|uniref:tetratricopeptide repeat protein n=1 Tax=Reichenbachiella sp. TaxID=2184521 RepID=UPI0032675557
MKLNSFKYFILIIIIASCQDLTDIDDEDYYNEAVINYKNEQYDQAIAKLDIILDGNNDSAIAIKALYLRGFSYYLQDKNKLAYQDYLEGIEIAESFGQVNVISKLNNEIGLIFLEAELYEQSLSHFLLALDQSGETTLQNKGHYNYNIGRSLRRLNRLDEGIEYFLTAIDINEQLRNYDALSNIYIEIGLLQQKVGNHSLALEHFQEIIKISQLSKNPNLFKWKAYNNIGNIYQLAGDFLQAESYFNKSLEYENDDSQLSVTYNNLGKICNKKGEYKKAWQYFKKSLAYNSKNVEINELGITNNALRKTFEKLNQTDSLLDYTMLINDMALSAVETRTWLEDEDEKIALLTKYQDYVREKAEKDQYAKTSWLMAFIMTFIFVSGVLSMRLWKIYNYKSTEKGHALIKNSNEMVYLLDMFKNEKEEMKKVMDQKLRA